MLVDCPECGREGLSDKAKACPDCAFPIAETSNDELPISTGPPPSRNENENRQQNSQRTSTEQSTPATQAGIHFLSCFYPGTWTTMGWIWAILGVLIIFTGFVSPETKVLEGFISGVAFILFAPFIRYYTNRSWSLLKQWGICFLLLILAGLLIQAVDPDKSLDSNFQFNLGTKIDISKETI